MRERIGGMGIKDGGVAYTLQYIVLGRKKGIQQQNSSAVPWALPKNGAES
jgi:hypothetical protein